VATIFFSQPFPFLDHSSVCCCLDRLRSMALSLPHWDPPKVPIPPNGPFFGLFSFASPLLANWLSWLTTVCRFFDTGGTLTFFRRSVRDSFFGPPSFLFFVGWEVPFQEGFRRLPHFLTLHAVSSIVSHPYNFFNPCRAPSSVVC